ncbi:MAG TPA: 4Fe-4S dicluster domain-containing protein [Chitinophagaceae bacterium]|nr:4Fe-4S dicluster domain-containing protein [Chitinophagaceae bacterium]
MEEDHDIRLKSENRRKFLQVSLIAGGGIAAGAFAISKLLPKEEESEASLNMVVFSREGKVYKVDESHLHEYDTPPVSNDEARKGIAGKKFVMVFDLAKCDGCKKCTEACQAMHFTEPDREWIKVYKMKDSRSTIPYYFPKPCFHCDNPPCTKVCPVNATFKRQDGIVLIDNERCIGCRSCMAACPYSTRYFNWSKPAQPHEVAEIKYSPEYGLPRRVGTVEKCDFCPHMARQGKLPACVAACPMDAIYFGDQNEDAVTNASGVTIKLSQLLEDDAGYRYMEELGTEPRVYYLPPKNRKYPIPDMDKKQEGKPVPMEHMAM